MDFYYCACKPTHLKEKFFRCDNFIDCRKIIYKFLSKYRMCPACEKFEKVDEYAANVEVFNIISLPLKKVSDHFTWFIFFVVLLL